VNFACAAALLVQLGFVLWDGYIRPSLTNTVVKEVDLKDIDFPVDLKICASPGFNSGALWKAGYRDTGDYFGGVSKYNRSLLGWAGHTDTSGVQGSVAEVLGRVRSHTVDDVVTRIRITSLNYETTNLNITNADLRRQNFPNNCYTLHLTNNAYVKGNGIQVLQIHVHQGHDQEVEMFFVGSSLTTDRIIKALTLYSTGDKIKILSKKRQYEFVVEIKQNVLLEQDPMKKCQNYPNPAFATYRDCDDQWMKEQAGSQAPGLLPIWLADDLEKVTTKYIGPAPSKLFDGNNLSDCPLPCKTTRTETKFLRSYVTDDKRTSVDIAFSQSVQVTTTDFVKPSLSTFLSDVGGSVGLWLGLGVVQAGQLVINCVITRLGGE
jgi:hypothetical protein